jgi:hypothetical protein
VNFYAAQRRIATFYLGETFSQEKLSVPPRWGSSTSLTAANKKTLWNIESG